jgi:hypothetical protein
VALRAAGADEGERRVGGLEGEGEPARAERLEERRPAAAPGGLAGGDEQGLAGAHRRGEAVTPGEVEDVCAVGRDGHGLHLGWQTAIVAR